MHTHDHEEDDNSMILGEAFMRFNDNNNSSQGGKEGPSPSAVHHQSQSDTDLNHTQPDPEPPRVILILNSPSSIRKGDDHHHNQNKKRVLKAGPQEELSHDTDPVRMMEEGEEVVVEQGVEALEEDMELNASCQSQGFENDIRTYCAVDAVPPLVMASTPKPGRSAQRTPSGGSDSSLSFSSFTNQEQSKKSKLSSSSSSSYLSLSPITSPVIASLPALGYDEVQNILEPVSCSSSSLEPTSPGVFKFPDVPNPVRTPPKPLERHEIHQLSTVLLRELDEVVKSATKQTEKLYATPSKVEEETVLTYTVTKVPEFDEVYNISLYLQKGMLVKERFHLSVTSEYPAQGPTFDIDGDVGGNLADGAPRTFKTLLRDGISRLRLHRFTVRGVLIEWVRVSCKFYRQICGMLVRQQEEQRNLRQQQLRLQYQQQQSAQFHQSQNNMQH